MFSQVFISPREGVGFPACITGHMTGGSACRGRGSASKGWEDPPPPELGKRAVRILLECILVMETFVRCI